MKTRAQQREETRHLIIEAAVQVFSDRGFHGASTRDIATRAGVNQGLLTYHFKNKDELWRAAADRIFLELRAQMAARRDALQGEAPRHIVREITKTYVRFAAACPELFRFMVEEGKHPGPRMRWLVDTHLKPTYEEFFQYAPIEENLRPHVFYTLAGAASTIFAVAPECKRLMGYNPTTKQAIETHAEYVTNLLLP